MNEGRETAAIAIVDPVKTAEFLRSRWGRTPAAGIILGTGLGELGRAIEVEAEIPYGEIPGFPASTAVGHAGQFLLGTLEGKPVCAMEGRFHLYEGYAPVQVTFPVRVMKGLGAEVLLVSNAAGGLNPQHRKGDLVLIEDHINLMGVNPLVGPNDDRFGPRFPDMSAPYDRGLLDAASGIALAEGIRAHTGVYVAVTGPNLETRAEYRWLRGMGADVVGMSTVPEVIVAVHAGMRVMGVSVVTDICLPDALEPVSVEEILAVAAGAEPKLTTLIRRVVAGLGT